MEASEAFTKCIDGLEELKTLIESSDEESVKVVMGLKAGCEDCARPYGDEHGFPDLVVPNEVWERLMPGREGGGLLCPCCMARRAYELGITCTAVFTSGPFVDRQIHVNSLLLSTTKLCVWCGGTMTEHKRGCAYVAKVDRIDQNIIRGEHGN